MRNSELLIVAAVALLVALAPVAFAQEFKTEGSEEFTVGTDCSFSLENISGDIELVGWDRATISVQFRKISRGARAELKAKLVKVVMDQRGDSVEVEVRYPDFRERRSAGLEKDKSYNVSVSFTVRVPRGCKTKLYNVSGDVEVREIDNDTYVRLISGDLTAVGISGKLDVKITSGDVEVNGAGGEINIHAISGEIELQDVSGQVEVHNTSGDITISARELQGAVLKTLSGDITLTTETPVTSGRFELGTFSGDIIVTLPAGSAFDLQARVSLSGSVRCEFDLSGAASRSRRELEGAVGGGGAWIKAKSSSGDIVIKRR